MERLRKDIPKFLDNSRKITTENKEWWNYFFRQANNIYSATCNQEKSTWLLDELKSMKFGRASVVGRDGVEQLRTGANETAINDFPIPNGVLEEVTVMVGAQLQDIPEVYTGPYRKPSGVTSVTNICDHVAVDSFIAVSLQNYNKTPVIGKVLEKNESTVKIHYWKGSWNKTWMPWFINKKEPWTDVLPLGCIYLAAFELDVESKLQSGTKRQMKDFF